MLRSFHYIDEKGKDQGINGEHPCDSCADDIVRNRASEIATLLGDLEKIRQERRKAQANKAKYGGVGSDGGMSFTQPGGGRFGGFGSESVNSGGGGGSGSASYRGGGGYDSGGDGMSSLTKRC
jgi:epsin